MQKTIKQKKNKIFLSAIFPIVLILTGVLLIIRAAVGENPLKMQIFKNNSSNGVDQKVNIQAAKPYQLFIPKISKVLYISDGQYINNQWVISKTGVSYLTASTSPGKVGNSVIYGHNLPELLGNLTQVQNGDLVYVLMDSGQFYKYKIFETKAVNPAHVEILNNSQDARLTIYTCTGFLDSARFVVIGDLVSGS